LLNEQYMEQIMMFTNPDTQKSEAKATSFELNKSIKVSPIFYKGKHEQAEEALRPQKQDNRIPSKTINLTESSNSN